jgi:hypothetical protein
MEILVQNKVLTHDDFVEDFIENLINLLKPRLTTLYEDLKIELFEKKRSQGTEIIKEMQQKIQDI